MSVVRQDEKGIYVICDGSLARPGDVNGYSHAYDMSDGGLKKGDRIKARHIGGTPLVKVSAADGETYRYWYMYEDSPEMKRLKERNSK